MPCIRPGRVCRLSFPRVDATVPHSSPTAVNRSAIRGSSHTPILVFAGIVGLSVVFFFIFSFGSFGKKPAPPPVAPAPTGPSAAQPVVTPLPSLPASPPPAQVTRFNAPDAVFAEFSARLFAGDTDGALKLLAPAVPTAAGALLKNVLTDGGWRVAASAPWRDAGVMAGAYRRELRLEPTTAEAAVPQSLVMVESARSEKNGWVISALRFDAVLTALAAGKVSTPSGAVDPMALATPDDPLRIARHFFDHVLSHDFKSARGLTDQEKVTHEKLAGLCIVFEEGEYKIAPARPVVVTAGTEDSAWAIVKIRSEKQNLDSEVGLEIKRQAGGPWRIEAIDFNRMLESYVQASGAGKVYYSPIVKSAKGGESIVVYFEFDKAGLYPRALHQLDIIASLLKSDPARKMRITGHTDDLGSDDYNQRLSAARAKNVHSRLLELGVAAAQIETIGFGATAPLDPNKRDDGTDNPEGRSRNRRTEIYLDF